MSWIAISDGRRCLRSPTAPGGRLVAKGSLLLEAQILGDRTEPLVLVSLDRDTGWRHRLRIELSPEGEVIVEHRQGSSASIAALHKPRVMANDTLRLTYSWNAPARHGLLTAENVDSGRIQQCLFEDPNPMPAEDIAELVNSGDGVTLDSSVSFLAASDRVEPVGPMPGFRAGTWIETAAGMRPIEAVRPGDLVVTASAGLQPVRHIVSREVPALGQFAPVCLRAPFFGLRTDMWTAPHHRVMIDGSDAEYLFGSDMVLVEARHLRPMTALPDGRRAPVVRYHQLVLPIHDCLHSLGAWAESLYIGSVARRPTQLASSLLWDVPPDRLPVHTEIAGPLLKPYEAMVLVSNMCA